MKYVRRLNVIRWSINFSTTELRSNYRSVLIAGNNRTITTFKIGAHARASRWTRNGVTRARRNSPTIKASREASIFKGKLSFVQCQWIAPQRDKGWKNNTFLRSNEISRRVVSILKWEVLFFPLFVCFFKRRDFDSYYFLLLFLGWLIFMRPSKVDNIDRAF